MHDFLMTHHYTAHLHSIFFRALWNGLSDCFATFLQLGFLQGRNVMTHWELNWPYSFFYTLLLFPFEASHIKHFSCLTFCPMKNLVYYSLQIKYQPLRICKKRMSRPGLMHGCCMALESSSWTALWSACITDETPTLTSRVMQNNSTLLLSGITCTIRKHK